VTVRGGRHGWSDAVRPGPIGALWLVVRGNSPGRPGSRSGVGSGRRFGELRRATARRYGLHRRGVVDGIDQAGGRHGGAIERRRGSRDGNGGAAARRAGALLPSPPFEDGSSLECEGGVVLGCASWVID